MKVRIRKRHAVFAALVVALSIPAAGSSRTSGLPTTIGPGEGHLTLVAWQGYTQPQWVKPFEKQSGCQINQKYACLLYTSPSPRD